MNQDHRHIHYASHSRRSQQIYLAVILLFISLVILLPVIHVDIGIRATGVIESESGRTTLYSPASGQVTRFSMQENSRVEAGDTLLMIDSDWLTEDIETHHTFIRQLTKLESDLTGLVTADSLAPELLGSVRTRRYRRSLIELLKQLEMIDQEIDMRRSLYDRNKNLFMREYASLEEKQYNKFRYHEKLTERDWILNEKIHRWTVEKQEIREQLRQRRIELRQMENDLQRYTLKAPVSGTIHSITRIQTGTYLPGDRPVAELSPMADLTARIYLTPGDIGLLFPGMPIRLRIDAFDHREWGYLEGVVTDIPDDITRIDGEPYYLIETKLNRDWMELSGGYRNDLIKGMTVQARLIINRRSLLQLLFDRLDDWMNPLWSDDSYDQRLHT